MMIGNHLPSFKGTWLLQLNITMIKSVLDLRAIDHVIWITIQNVLIINILQNLRWRNYRTQLWFILSLLNLSRNLSSVLVVFISLVEALISELLLRSCVISLRNCLLSWLIMFIVRTFVTGAGVVFVLTDVLIFLLRNWYSLSLIMLTPKWLTNEIMILLLLFMHLILEFGITWKTIIFILT
jgi:hypothetical protein